MPFYTFRCSRCPNYTKGFTLIEMLISIIITISVTLTMMFVYNQSIKKFYVDSMEYDIKVYKRREYGCNEYNL